MKKIIFDFDGTILDSSQRHVNVLKDCLLAFGHFEVCLDDYLAFKADGNSTKDYLAARLKLDAVECNTIAAAWSSKIEEWEYLKSDFLYPDALAALKVCTDMGHRLYLVSARKNQENLIKQVKLLGLNCLFYEVYCVSPEKASKNKAERIRNIEANLIVGDTESEWEAAVQTHTSYFILNRGFRSKHYWDFIGIKSYDSLNRLIRFISNTEE